MIFKDRIAEHLNYVSLQKLKADKTPEDEPPELYQMERVEGIISEEGTPINAAVFNEFQATCEAIAASTHTGISLQPNEMRDISYELLIRERFYTKFKVAFDFVGNSGDICYVSSLYNPGTLWDLFGHEIIFEQYNDWVYDPSFDVFLDYLNNWDNWVDMCVTQDGNDYDWNIPNYNPHQVLIKNTTNKIIAINFEVIQL
jgi:hypothetical protein